MKSEAGRWCGDWWAVVAHEGQKRITIGVMVVFAKMGLRLRFTGLATGSLVVRTSDLFVCLCSLFGFLPTVRPL